jgi:hypothetical protein
MRRGKRKELWGRNRKWRERERFGRKRGICDQHESVRSYPSHFLPAIQTWEQGTDRYRLQCRCMSYHMSCR